MSTVKRVFAATVAGALALGMAGCSSGPDEPTNGEGKVYYLNYKPEQDEAFKEIAAKYQEETGVEVKIVTAGSGTYEQTLKSEMSKSGAPTLFNVKGPADLRTWKDYVVDLTDSTLMKELKDENLALKDDTGAVFGVPMAVEGYGIIYNDAIFQKYFATSGAKASSAEEINSFQKLKEVADDMQAKKDELGIDGAFASTSLAPGEGWRWHTHLLNLPVHFEYQDAGVTSMDDFQFEYGDLYKNTFDLYLDNSTVARTLTPSKNVTDSMAEFALGQAAMVQNGNWAWGQISDVEGNIVKPEDIKMMPIYTGHDGEENQGLCVGTEAFISINAKAPEADQKATEDFINWLFTSEEGKEAVVEKLHFIAPYSQFGDSDVPDDPLAREVATAMNDSEKENVPWAFVTLPSRKFRDDFAESLGQYASGSMQWPDVISTTVANWAAEAK